MGRIEILVVGHEILTGRTLEANANWLAKRIVALGGAVARITILDDDPEAIAALVLEAKERGTRLLLTTGGLGPTFDDRTLAGIAQAIGVPLRIDPEARQFIEDKYHALFRDGLVETDGLTPEREKMANLPAGGTWLDNPVGTAPGMAVRFGEMEIYSMPGVPREIHAMFDLALSVKLAEMFGRAGFAEVTMPTDATDESILTRLAAEMCAKYIGLHVKTNPTYFGDDEGLRVTFSANAVTNEAARTLVEQAMADFKKQLAAQADAGK
ncbi:MAG: competence/damage-inducible protein A [Myxococcales bacterium]|nr:competence/damage-inducible protein A [Myxococcales bacterium]